MYSAKNSSGAVTMTGKGDSMASGLQGTATCWSDIECLSGQTCQTVTIPGYPIGIGICSGQSPATDCASPADVGNQCSNYATDGYTNSLVIPA
jgi:hypothetical protein